MASNQIRGAQEASSRLQRDYNSSKNKQPNKKKAGLGTWLVVALVLLAPRLLELLNNARFSSAFSSLRVRYMMAVRRLEIQLGLSRLARDLTRSFGFDPLPLLALILVIVLLVLLIKAAKKKSVEGVADADRSGRVSAAVRRADPRSKSFTNPDPYCVVCDHTGDDHFKHDKAQRIRQLDEWLKNGLISREEYKVLKNRYERDL